MRVIIQRVKNASVEINGSTHSSIGPGLLVLLGIEHEDQLEDVQWLASKVVRQRIFSDEEGKMNLDCLAVKGEILLVSQFTLHASTKKGNRPSFIRAAHPSVAIPLYEAFKRELQQLLGREVPTGEFGADMQVHLVNDGPVTIFIDSKMKE